MSSLSTASKPSARLTVGLTIAFGLAIAASSAGAEPQTAAADEPGLALELNKLEPIDKGCRAYVVVTNKTDSTYEAFKLDLVLFQNDGVIGRRFSLDLAPVRPQKKAVKLFEIDGMACDKIGQFLINDVIDCKVDQGATPNCLRRLSTSSLTTVQLSK
ncbi:MAG: hypothetical protein ACT4OU_08515 [Hyphomicrobium sp.]